MTGSHDHDSPGRFMRVVRKAARLSRAQLGALLDIGPKTVYFKETGRRPVQKVYLLALRCILIEIACAEHNIDIEPAITDTFTKADQAVTDQEEGV
jgi:DNA-binding XRE family transcriptional regulator